MKVTKAAATKTLKAGTYKWADAPAVPNTLITQDLNFISDGKNMNYAMGAPTGATIRYGYIDSEGDQLQIEAYKNQTWSRTAYQTIVLATDQQVSAEFYDWAITGGNLQAVLIVPVSVSIVSGSDDTIAYINANSSIKPTATDYEYKIVGNSNGATITDKSGATLSSFNVPFYCSLNNGVWNCVGKLYTFYTSGGLEQRAFVNGTGGTSQIIEAELFGDGSYKYTFTTSDPFSYTYSMSTSVEYSD